MVEDDDRLCWGKLRLTGCCVRETKQIVLLLHRLCCTSALQKQNGHGPRPTDGQWEMAPAGDVS